LIIPIKVSTKKFRKDMKNFDGRRKKIERETLKERITSSGKKNFRGQNDLLLLFNPSLSLASFLTRRAHYVHDLEVNSVNDRATSLSFLIT